MKKVFLLLVLILVLSMQAQLSHTVYTDSVTSENLQEYIDSTGIDGSLTLVNLSSEECVYTVNLVLNHGQDLYLVGPIRLSYDIAGWWTEPEPLYNTVAAVDGNSIFSGGVVEGGPDNTAIYFSGVNNRTESVVIQNSSIGIYLGDEGELNIVDCDIEADYGIKSMHDTDVGIRNTVVNATEYGILVQFRSQVDIDGCHIFSEHSGVQIGFDTDILMTNSDVESHFRDFESIEGGEVLLRKNKFQGNSIGIYLENTEYVEARNNIIRNMLAYDGIRLDNCHVAYIYNNDFQGLHNGIWIGNQSEYDRLSIINNIFSDCDLVVGGSDSCLFPHVEELKFNHYHEVGNLSWNVEMPIEDGVTEGNPMFLNSDNEISEESPCFESGFADFGWVINKGSTGILRRAPDEISEEIISKPQAKALNAYPNPFNSVINVETESFSVYDLNGKIIARVNGSRWAPQGVVSGVYIVRDDSGGMTRVVYQK